MLLHVCVGHFFYSFFILTKCSIRLFYHLHVPDLMRFNDGTSRMFGRRKTKAKKKNGHASICSSGAYIPHLTCLLPTYLPYLDCTTPTTTDRTIFIQFHANF